MKMKHPLLALALPCLLVAPACGDDSTSGDDEVGTDGGTDTATSTADTAESGDSMDTTGDGDTTTADTTGDGDTTADTTGDGDTTADTTGDGDTGTADTTGDGDTGTADTTGDGDTGTADTTGDGDTGTTGGDLCMGGGNNNFDFSYIWIANSPQGTVSKIDTEAAVEVARYYTGPAGDRDPSRTSVSGNGKFAAVANRDGGLTMISAEEDGCVDLNNNGMIDTSAGPNDILDWGTDECVLWNIPLPGSGNTGPRPISWTIGEQDPLTCEYSLGDIWIGWYDQGGNTGHFRLVEGSSGNTLDEVSVPNWSGMNWGPYGGAIDSENNFWAIGWGQNGPVVKIDGMTHEATHFGNPGGWIYGMGLDLQGNTYAAGCGTPNVYRFDKMGESWSLVGNLGGSCLRGLQVDQNGVAWIAKNGSCGLGTIDTQANPPAVLDANIALPGCATPVGVSIDAQGYVWVVDQGASKAFKVDPDTKQVVAEVGGLVSPYTYSDMTGAGINAQIFPQ